ncbi:MAG: hypothetical protein AAGC93_17065 [Cyanobacteria bacterium P01_F01_bin.53]
MEQISINLTLEEVNTILESLGRLPYTEVFQLIHKVKAQAEAQVQANAMRRQEHHAEVAQAKSEVLLQAPV